MKDLVEGGVADARGTGVLDERQRIPLAEHRKVTGTKQLECNTGHRRNIPGDEHRVIVGPRTVRAGDKDHLRCHGCSRFTTAETAAAVSDRNILRPCASGAFAPVTMFPLARRVSM